VTQLDHQDGLDSATDHEVDILVVGSGAGALTSALTAAIEGADVLVVEKASRYGGTSASSGGAVWIPNSEDARRKGFTDSPQDAHSYMSSLVGDTVPADRVQAYLDQAPRMLAYMEARTHVAYEACAYPDYCMDKPGAKTGGRTHDPSPIMADRLGTEFAKLEPPHPLVLTFGRFSWTLAEAKLMATMSPGAKPMLAKLIARYLADIGWRLRTRRSRRLTGGNALLARLKLSLDEQGVPIWLDTPMISLIRQGAEITGAKVFHGGKTVSVRARRGVFLGSGGFDHNLNLREKYLPAPTGRWSAGVVSNTGIALEAGEAVGAATDRLASAWRTPGFFLENEDRPRPLFMERSLPFSLVVNQAGKRFMNEAASYHDAGNLIYQANGPDAGTIPSWLIFDAKYRSRYMVGLMIPGAPVMDRFLPEAMRKILRKSTTLAGLAVEIDVPKQALLQTVDRFNRMAKTGRDLDFQRGESAYDRHFADLSVKPNPTLGPLEKGPFYAIPIYPCDLGTNGGLVTDAAGCVLDRQGQIIRGLYAFGNAASSVMGPSYPGAGATLGPAMTFGWIAAHHALGKWERRGRKRQVAAR